MLPRSALKLAVILALSTEVAFGSHQEQLPSRLPNLDVIKIELKPGELGRLEKPKPFIVGDLFSFQLVMTNTSNGVVDIKASQVLLQEHPELLRDGRLLPFLEGRSSDRLQSGETYEEDPMRPGLLPQQSKGIASVVLNDWYEPLSAGRYQLILRHRIDSTKDWREASITFDILPSALGLAKTPFTSDFFSNLDDEVVRSLSAKKPAWRHERVKPMTGSENIIIDYWVSGRERVRVHSFEFTSPEKATQTLQSYYGEANERLTGLGDEGLVRSGNKVSFRRGRLLIEVSSLLTEVSAAVNSARVEFGQQLRINKEFARYIADALPMAGLYSKVILPRPPFATASQLKIALTLNGHGAGADTSPGPVSKFRRDTEVSFGLVMENIAAEPIKVQVFFNHMQNRPDLFREGQLVPYLEQVQKLVMSDKEPPDYRRLAIVLLHPNKPETPEIINLAEWYGPLQPGHYRLNNKNRLDIGQDWIDCGSITFEVSP
jgi:hypothetical protein